MKKFNQVVALLLGLVMALSLAACGGEGGGNDGENTAPKISGVADQAVEAGSSFDALNGVTASDPEDGDLTGSITVTSNPALTFTGGKATPETAGSYELTYSVTDKGGKTAEAYATLTVTRKTGEAVEFMKLDFADYTPDTHGWTASIADGVQAAGEAKQGAFVFDITDPGAGDGDIQLKKAGVAVKPADYKLKVWAKSTKETYAHMFARNEAEEGWVLFGDTYNQKIGTSVTPIELNFTVSAEGTAELILNLGKITPNPDNPADSTPADFTVTIDKIELYEVTGTDIEVPVYTNDYSAPSAAALAVSAGDGANASVAGNVFTIANYPTEGGKLYYRIDQGGNTDFHNKLIVGHGGNKLTLPADSYFIVSVTGKATKPVSCGFFLNPMGGWDPRLSEGIDFTTEEQTFTFETTETLIMDMDFEMLFQFGSDALAGMGEVTVEISDITIQQRSVL